jgi:hypothetical protein
MIGGRKHARPAVGKRKGQNTHFFRILSSFPHFIKRRPRRAEYRNRRLPNPVSVIVVDMPTHRIGRQSMKSH